MSSRIIGRFGLMIVGFGVALGPARIPAFADDLLVTHRLSAELAAAAAMETVASCAKQNYAETAVLVDDIIDTAGTLVKTAQALLDAGAVKIYAAASHAVLSGPAIERITNSRLQEVIVTDSIPLREDAQRLERQGRIKVLSVAGLLGATIESIHMETSVSSLFS